MGGILTMWSPIHVLGMLAIIFGTPLLLGGMVILFFAATVLRECQGLEISRLGYLLIPFGIVMISIGFVMLK